MLTDSDPWAEEKAKTSPFFEAALYLALTYRGHANIEVKRLLAREPRSVFGHCMRAALIVRTGAPAHRLDLARSLTVIENSGCAEDSLPRLHAKAARAWLAGDAMQALDAYGAILEAHPCDVLALIVAHALDFHLGQRAQLLKRISTALKHWEPGMAGYPSVLAMHAFALEECGRYREAELQAREALARDPNLPAAIHVLAHVMEMEGRAHEGLALLATTEASWIEGTEFSVHLAWHRALFHLEADGRQAALDVYDREIMKVGAMDAPALADAASLLWRLQLLEFSLGFRWQHLARRWLEMTPLNVRPFFAPHAMMAFVSAGRMIAAKRLLSGLGRSQAMEGDLEGPEHALALPLSKALGDFVRRDYAGCIAQLSRVRAISDRCGGSIAQCDLIHLTLTEAALREGEVTLAESLVAERAALKPHSPINLLLQRRLNEIRPLAVRRFA